MAPRRSLLSVLALASALILSGCGGDTQPNTSNTPTASETPSPTPTVDTRPTPASSTAPARNLSKPELPEAAKQNTEEGFEAFTQYWFDTITYAFETGDMEPLRSASKPDCKICNGFLEDAAQARTGGQWYVPTRWTVTSFQSDLSRDPLGQALGHFFLDETASAIYASDGTIKTSRPAANDGKPKAIYAVFDGASWITSQAGNT